MKAIVPGIHDYLPREGRLVFELFDERMRLKHRTRAENSLTNQFREAMQTGFRGQPANRASAVNTIGFDAFETGSATNTDDMIATAGDAVPHIYARHYQFCLSLYLSGSSAAVDDDWWWPLGLHSGARLDADNTFTDNKRRGNRVKSLMQRTPALQRYVVDFGLNIANGLPIESAGLAGVRFPGTDAFDGVYGWMTSNAFGGQTASFGAARTRSVAPVPGAPFKVWILGDEGSFEYDFTLSASWASTAIRSITGPSLATWGSPSASNSGIAIIGSDFWMMDTTRLRRFAMPTSSSLPTLNNTYSPVSGFTDAACLGLCSDGTDLYALGSTKVFVISTSTGAVTSSWTHNVSLAVNIWYDAVHDCVWITGADHTVYTRDGYLINGNPSAYQGDLAHAAGQGFTNAAPFSKTGTALGYGWQPLHNSSAGSLMDVYWSLDGGRVHFFANPGHPTNASNATSAQSGGILGTRALVDAPFTKVNTEILRVTYELAFADLA